MRVLVAPLIALLSLAFAACAQGELQLHSDSYNRAIEASTNDQLLLNIVRASQDLPLHFTGTGKYVGTKLSTASINPKLPFGRDAPLNFDLAPKFDWSSGVSTIDFGNLNNEETLQRLSQDVRVQELETFRYSDIPFSVITTLLFESFIIHEKLLLKIGDARQRACQAELPHPSCGYLTRIAKRCGARWFDAGRGVYEKQVYIAFNNLVRDECEYLRFQGNCSPLCGSMTHA